MHYASCVFSSQRFYKFKKFFPADFGFALEEVSPSSLKTVSG